MYPTSSGYNYCKYAFGGNNDIYLSGFLLFDVAICNALAQCIMICRLYIISTCMYITYVSSLSALE